MNAYRFRTLLIEHEGGVWSAHCLEYDIAAQANSLSDVQHEIYRVLVAHIVVAKENNQEPFTGLGRAPAEYWEMFDATNLDLVVRDGEFDDELDDEEDDIPHPAMLPGLDMRIARRLV